MKAMFKSLSNKAALRSIASLALGLIFAAVPAFVAAQYQGAEYCSGCHSQQYHDWLTSGHKQILMEGVDAQHRSLPVPGDLLWDDISYVVGGNRTKALYLDDEGYFVTNSTDSQGRPVAGHNQFNLLTGEWSDYRAGENNVMYDCGECHTTGYQAGGSPAGLPGISGTFALPGVQCEHCHGPGDSMEGGDSDPAFCGTCHNHGPSNVVAASGGFIKPEGQYNEFLAGAHANLSCISCHNPHQNAEYGARECATCHASKAASYAGTVMDNAGVECQDCHMSYATLSAQALGPHQGDERTHIFRINTDPSAAMFSPDGSSVVQVGGEAAVTLDFACQRCHGSSSKEALAPFAKDFHDNDGSLANFGLDPGLSGTWWNPAKSGEGFLLEVGKSGANKFLYVSFYTYSPAGEQTWLVAATTNPPGGNTGEVTVYIPSGGTWGDPSGADTSIQWGTGTFSFPTCSEGTFTFTPNQAMIDMGYTALSYNLERILGTDIACPTLVMDLL
jgi:hypothetical protein